MKKIALILLAALLLASLSACGESAGEAYVQNVGEICGVGALGMAERFAGTVVAQSEIKIEKTETGVIQELLVHAGDSVAAGQTLFTYDTEQGQLELERAQIELEIQQGSLKDKQDEKARLEKERDKASANLQLSYSLEIRQLTADIQEAEYNLKLKEQEIARMQLALENTNVVSPVDGRVQSINENGGYDDYGNRLPFMTIVETETYRVSGSISETNLGALGVGAEVLIRSRVDDTVWHGFISSIDFENPVQNNNNYYYGDSGNSATKYPFYVELDGSEGLLLGQHVFIEPDYGQESGDSALALPSYYILDLETSPYVWAQDSQGKLEKRSLVLGAYDETFDSYELVSGLSASDYIAFPDETLRVGMICSPYSVAEWDNYGESAYPDDGAYYGEEEFSGDEGFYVEEGAALNNGLVATYGGEG